MPYSLVGASALGFDLARLAGGERTAIVLRGALAASPGDLAGLAAAHPGHLAREEWRRARTPGTTTSRLVDVLPLAVAGPGGLEGDTELLRRLEVSLLGDVDALDRLVRHELLDWTWERGGDLTLQHPTAARAADVLSDAATASFLHDDLEPRVRRAMAGALLRSALPLPDEPGATGVTAADRRLRELAVAGDAERRAWRRVVDDLRPHTAEWAPAMHQATWALSTTERLRLATDVQLAGVIAMRHGGFTSRDAAYGVWNALSGVLQASVVEDLLSTRDADVLMRPWRLVTGSAPPRH